MRLFAVALAASALGLAMVVREDPSDQQTPMPPSYTIRMEYNRFDPQGQAVEAGKKLTWLNKDDVPHDVDFTSGASFNSDPVGKGQTIEFTPQSKGEITYVCSVHPSMQGELIVE